MNTATGFGTESAPASNQPIGLAEGTAVILTNGLQPYLDKIELGVSDEEYNRQRIPAAVYTQTYDVIFRMCIQREPENWSAQLYEMYCSEISKYLNSKVTPALQSEQQKHVVAFLKEWNERWIKQQRAVNGPASMFKYLDRFYVPNNEQVPLLKKGYTLCREIVFDKFAQHVTSSILSCIAKERAGEAQDRELLNKAIKVFVDLGFSLHVDVTLYRDNFEVPFVDHTRLHYKQQSRMWLEQDSCPDYLRKAEQCLEEEKGRLDSCLNATSEAPLMLACREEMLKFHETELLEKKSGIDDMLNRLATEDLSRLYKLYSAVEDGNRPIADALREHIKRLGYSLIDASKNKSKDTAAQAASDKSKSAADQHELIRQLIDLHDRFRDIVKNCFNKDQMFEKSLKEAFEDFINKEFYTSNLLAKFINDVLTKDSKVQVYDVEKTLDNVVMIYGYIRQKDVFEEKYHNFLANRLLTRKSESEHAEKNMIGKLKNEAGYQWTSKLETMFKDVVRSQELMEEFNKANHNQFNEELNVIVCTSGCWPSSSVPSFTLPTELSPICDKFKEFYLSRFAGTKLSWALHQGEAEIVVQFNPSTSRVLVVSTYQMTLMLMFNQKKILKFSEIAEATQIPKPDLISHILSLAHPKIKVLLKKPNVKEVKDDDEFAINSKFTSKAYRVVIPLINVKQEGTGANEEVSAMVMIQRRHQIDAAIVRVMKTRLRLGHNQLIAEVVKQLQRFKPDAGDIKKRIEALIEQEYLERDENDRKMYNYLA